MELNCGNGIATIATNFFPPILAMALSQNKSIFFPSYFGNAIATIPFHSFFFFFFLLLRNDNNTQFLQQILSGRLLLLD